MSTSGSSAADTPESEHALSVLDFAEQYTDDTAHQCPRSSATRRKRQRDVPSQEEGRQHRPSISQQAPHEQTCNTAKETQCTAGSRSVTLDISCCTPSPTTYYVAIHNCLMQWCCRLKALQPKCLITRDVLHRTLDLFHRYRVAIQTDLLSPQRRGATAVHLAACLWVASKTDGNRACVPSRTLLTRAIAVCPRELTQAELAVCCKLRWNLFNCEVASVL
ncbi:hypothetical protein ABBQ38_013308 [Trebouxia sp. C0009 RCD-2024]